MKIEADITGYAEEIVRALAKASGRTPEDVATFILEHVGAVNMYENGMVEISASFDDYRRFTTVYKEREDARAKQDAKLATIEGSAFHVAYLLFAYREEISLTPRQIKTLARSFTPHLVRALTELSDSRAEAEKGRGVEWNDW